MPNFNHYHGNSHPHSDEIPLNLNRSSSSDTRQNYHSKSTKTILHCWWNQLRKWWRRFSDSTTSLSTTPAASPENQFPAEPVNAASAPHSESIPSPDLSSKTGTTFSMLGSARIEVRKIETVSVFGWGVPNPSAPSENSENELDLISLGNDSENSQLNEFLKSVPGLQVTKLIGFGGMGIVFEAYDRLGRKRALKVTRPNKLSENVKKRFFHEAYEMSQFSHPNLVPIVDYQECLGIPYLVMPEYESSVSELIKSGQLNQRNAVRLFRDSIRGLAFLHGQGYIHRDFKPANILVDEKGNGVLSDFGLLKQEWSSDLEKGRLTQVNGQLTPTQGVTGTVPYLSPETLWDDSPKPSPKWDIYAAGISFYEMLVGKRPPVSENPYLYLGKSRREAIPPVAQSGVRVPQVYETIIHKCCRVDTPYRNAQDLLRDLIRYENRWYRRGFFGLCLLFLMLMVSLAMLCPPSQRLKEELIPNPYNELYNELAEGKTVELIPKEGMPRFPYRVIIDKSTVPTYDNVIKSFTIKAPNFSETYVELIPSLPPGDYLLSGELVCTGQGDVGNYGGIYFSGHEIPYQEKRLYTAQVLRFCDCLTSPQSARICNYHREKEHLGMIIEEIVEKTPFVQRAPEWRAFTITLHAHSSLVEFDGHLFQPWRRMGRLRVEFNNDPPILIHYSNEGSIGLIAHQVSMSCRNLSIRSLNHQEK